MIGRAHLYEIEEHLEEHTEEETAASPASIADELEIRRVVDEIDNATDEKNWARCRSFFTEEVDVDFVSLAAGGGEPSRIKADELIDAWKTNLYAEKKSFHLRGNHRIKIKGTSAEVFSKGYAFNLLETGEVTGLWEVWGNYKHTLERTEKGWRVSGMTLIVTHTRGDDRVRTFVP